MCDHRRALPATVCQFGALLFYQGCGVLEEEEQQKLCS